MHMNKQKQKHLYRPSKKKYKKIVRSPEGLKWDKVKQGGQETTKCQPKKKPCKD